DIAPELLPDGEGMLIVFSDSRVAFRASESVAGIDVGAANDYDVVDFLGSGGAVFRLHGPGGAAAGVTVGLVRDKRSATQGDLLAIVEHAIDFCRRIQILGDGAIVEVLFAAGFDDRDICVHHHVFRPGQLLDPCATSAVVKMRVADQKNFDVGKLEAQFLDTLANLRHARFEVAVDEDVAGRRSDQIAGQAQAADIVDV